MRITDRYIIRELVPPFLLGVGGVLVLLVGDILYTLAGTLISGRLPAEAVVRLLAFKIPAVLVVTFPVATLFGVLLGLSRLARDHELQAMRLVGVSLPRLMVPVLLFGAVVAAATLATNEAVTPWGNRRANALLRLRLPDAFPVVRQQVFLRAPQGRVIYIAHIDDRTGALGDVMIFEGGGPYPRLTSARHAVAAAGRWKLRDGIVREFDARGFTTVETAFARMEIPLGVDPGGAPGGPRTPEEMTFGELRAHLRMFGAGSPARAQVEYHRKLAVPAASLVFALVGGPLSLLAARGGRFVGVGLAVVLLFVYYVAMSVARALGDAGALSPPAAAWAPNLLFVAGGLALLTWEDGSRRRPGGIPRCAPAAGARR